MDAEKIAMVATAVIAATGIPLGIAIRISPTISRRTQKFQLAFVGTVLVLGTSMLSALAVAACVYVPVWMVAHAFGSDVSFDWFGRSAVIVAVPMTVWILSRAGFPKADD